jgi:CHASE3 domain sensor protein
VPRGLTLRAALACTVVAVIVVGAFAILLAVLQNLLAVDRADTRSAAVIAAATSLQFSVLELEDGLRGYEIAGKAPFLEHFWHAVGAYPGQAWLLERLTAPDGAAHSQAVAITAAIRHYEVSWADPLVVLSETDAAAARRTTANGRGQALVDAILARLSALDQHEQAAVSAHHRNADRVAELALGLGVAAAGLCTLAVALLAIGAQRRVVRPVHRIAAAVAQVRSGDLSVRVPAHGAPEIRDLAGGFNAMADYLQNRRDEVIEQHAELESQGLALRNAFSALEERTAWAETLHEFGQGLAEQRSEIEAVCVVALREIADYARVTLGGVHVLNERTGSYTLVASRGFAPGEVARYLPLHDGSAGRAMAEKRPLTVTYPETTLHLADHEIRHELHLPLRHGGISFGVISLGRRGEFTAVDVAAAGALAEIAAVACAAALGQRRAEVLAEDLQALMESTDEGICLTDVPGCITFINRSATKRTRCWDARLTR